MARRRNLHLVRTVNRMHDRYLWRRLRAGRPALLEVPRKIGEGPQPAGSQAHTKVGTTSTPGVTEDSPPPVHRLIAAAPSFTCASARH